MNLENSLTAIKNKEPLSFSELIVLSAIGGSNIIYSPTNNKEYNIKHRFECIILSAITHIIFFDAKYPNLSKKVRSDLGNKIISLIEETEINQHLDYWDFSSIYPGRIDFYTEEISKISPSSTSIPFRLLSLLYDHPLTLDIERDVACVFDFDIDTRIPQFIQVKNFIKFVINSSKQLSIYKNL